VKIYAAYRLVKLYASIATDDTAITYLSCFYHVVKLLEADLRRCGDENEAMKAGWTYISDEKKDEFGKAGGS
jgi:hypothetical protein